MAVITPIDETRFAELAGPLVGLPIAAVWLGDYTALYLELGALTDLYPDSGRPKAQHSAYLGFHWLLESDAGQELSSTDPGAATRVADALTGQEVAAVTVSPSRELILNLASGRRLCSIASERGEPEWALYLPSDSCIAAGARGLVLESRAA